MQTYSGGKYVLSKWIGHIMKKEKIYQKNEQMFDLLYGLLLKGDTITSKILLKTIYFRFKVCNAKTAKPSHVFITIASIPELKGLHNEITNL